MKKFGTNPYTVYVGTYTQPMSFVNGKGEGIYIYQMDPVSGKLEFVNLVRDVINPSFLCLHPTENYLYAVNEIGRSLDASGTVSAFTIDPTTKELTFLNKQITHGLGPCFVSLDSSGQYVLVANYVSGSLCVLPIQPDGSLAEASHVVQLQGAGLNLVRQDGPHAHMIRPGPAGKHIFALDLGSDKILLYHLDTAQGELIPTNPPWASLRPGTGPRHFAFHPNGRYLYVLGELASTISVFHYAASSAVLDEQQFVSTLLTYYPDQNLGAELQVHPNGRYVYASNRGDDSIVTFGVDLTSGKLSFLDRISSQGKSPRHFIIEPSGNILLCANQDSDSLVTFKIDQETGQLEYQGDVTRVPTPVCIQILA